MDTTFSGIETAALALPESARAHLALLLLQSLPPEEEPIDLDSVLDARMDAYERGEIEAVDLDVALAEVKRQLAERREP